MLAVITGANELEDEDPLEEYLEAPIQTMMTNPLKYWHNALINGTANAALTHMALDVLSIPGKVPSWSSRCALISIPPIATSVDAERAFSHGQLTVSQLCHSLSEQTVHTSTVLGSWAHYPELVPEADAVTLLKVKGKGNKTAAVDTSLAQSDRAPAAGKGDVITLSDSESN